MNGKKTIALLCVLLCITMLSTDALSLLADNPTPELRQIKAEENENANGKYVVSVLRGGQWQEAGRLGYDMFLKEKTLDLSGFLQNQKEAVVRIKQEGGEAAHLDSVFLGGEAPQSVNWNDGILLGKLSKKDLDLIGIASEGVELVFPANRKDDILALTGRIEGDKISQEPFKFPSSNNYREINRYSDFYYYQLNSVDTALTVDGDPEEVQNLQPLFKEFCISGTGHPEGYVYAWVMNDQDYLYAVMDVTPDNTMDGDMDYAMLHIKTDSDVKEFRVSVPETEWGLASFTYTDKVDYQHKLYEFKIPLCEIGALEDGYVQLAFSGYGTWALPYYMVHPDLAYNEDDDNYLVVYESINNGQGIYCQIANENAEWEDDYYYRVDTDLADIYDEYSDYSIYNERPVVAYDNINHKYLVIWECSLSDYVEAKLVGQFINPDGSADGSTFVVSEINRYAESPPAIAYNDINGEFLVVWEDSDPENDQSGTNIYGRIVDYDKSPLMNNIVDISVDEGYQSRPSVSYGRQDNCYMIVWENNHEEGGNTLHDIYGCTFKSGSVEQIFPVEPDTDTPTDNTRRDPSVTYDNGNEEFIVVWADNRNSTQGNTIYDLYAATVDITSSEAVVVDNEEMYSSGTYYDNISVEYNSYWDNTCAVWSSDSNVYYLLTSGYWDEESAYGSELIYPEDSPEEFYCGNPSLAANTNHNNFVAAYTTSYMNNNNPGNICLKLIGEPVEYDPKAAINPALAYNFNENNYLLVYSNHEYYLPVSQMSEGSKNPTGETSYSGHLGIVGQFISNTAEAEGEPFPISKTIEHCYYHDYGSFPDAAYGDGKYLVVWAEVFERMETSYMTTVNIMGNFIDKDNESFTGDPFPIVENAGYDPEYFFDNNLTVTYGEDGKFLVAYSDGENILGRMVELDKTDNETPKISDDDISICSFESYQTSPSAAYSPIADRFLVIWEDSRNDADSDLYGKLLDKDGKVINPKADDLPICAAALEQCEPSAAYNSNTGQFTVTWIEVNPHNEEDYICGMHFNAEGAPVGDADKVIVSKPADKEWQEYRNLSTVYNPTAKDEYFSVWSTFDYEYWESWGAGQHISKDLAASGDSYAFGKGMYNGGNPNLDIACNTKEGNYLVAYPCVMSYMYRKTSSESLNSKSSYEEYGDYIKWELIGDPAPETPGKIQFKETEDGDAIEGCIYYEVDEDAGTIEIPIERFGGSLGEVTVTYAVYGDAEDPGDYNIIGDYPVFANGDNEDKYIKISIRDDSKIEPGELILLELSDAEDAELGENRKAEIYIIDNDSASVKFSSPKYSEDEDAGYADITVFFSGLPEEDPEVFSTVYEEDTVFSVVYSTSNGTAKAGEDYKAVSGVWKLGLEADEMTFRVTIIDDSKDEDNETVNLKLSFPEPEAYRSKAADGSTIWVDDYPVNLGAPSILTILDDDSSSPSKPSGGKSRKSRPPVIETPPPTENLPNDALVDRMPGYITLSTPIKINGVKSEISLDYNKSLLDSNPGHDPRVYYWNPSVSKWVALATYPDGEGKVKSINDGGYSGWFVVFGVVQPDFSDISNSWAERLINRMNGLGLIEGYEVEGSETRVARPHQMVTRAEFTMFVTRIMNMNPDNILLPDIPESEVESILEESYSDGADIPSWVRAATAKATKAGLIPFEGSDFKPLEPITRIEAAVMVSRALRKFKDFEAADLSGFVDSQDIPGWAVGQVVEGALEGYPDSTIKPNSDIARAESLAILMRLFIKGLGW